PRRPEPFFRPYSNSSMSSSMPSTRYGFEGVITVMFGSMYEKYFATSFRANALLSSSTSCHTSDSIADVVISSALGVLVHLSPRTLRYSALGIVLDSSQKFILLVRLTKSFIALPTGRLRNCAHLLPCLFGAYILLAAAFSFSIASINGTGP